MHPSIATFAADGCSGGAGAVLADLGFAVGQPRRVTRTVLDTFDGLLHDAGLRLEVRDEGARRAVLLSGEGVVGVRVSTTVVPVWPSDLPAGPLRARVAAIVDVRALQPVLSVIAVERQAVRFDRRRKELVRATVVEDAVATPGEVPIVPAALIELEALAGYPKPAAEAAAALTRRGAVALHTDLLDHAARATGVDLRGFSSSPSVPLDAAMPALDGWCAVLANLAATARANWPGTVAEIDTEFLHELRVAVRRTRSILGHGKGVIPPHVLQPAREAFAALGSATGPSRDFDVQLLEWSDHARELGAATSDDLEPVRTLLVERHRLAHGLLNVILGSPSTHAALDVWESWLVAPSHVAVDVQVAPLADARLGAVVAKRIRRAHATIIDNGRRIHPDTPPDPVHDLRKDAKKLRYLLECFATLLPSAERKQFVRTLKVLQDNLGEHQDAAVHVEELRAIGLQAHRRGASAATMLALGELSAHLDQRRAAARGEFAERFAEFDTAATRQSMKAMLAGLDGSS